MKESIFKENMSIWENAQDITGKGGYKSAYFISQFYSERMEEGDEEMLIAASVVKLWAASSFSFILLSVCPMFSIIKRVYVYNQEKK